jgi:hypothetical protein
MLGHGEYSTVWLVEDINSGKFASLKVLSAEGTMKSSKMPFFAIAISSNDSSLQWTLHWSEICD